jgi:hypothetical protein
MFLGKITTNQDQRFHARGGDEEGQPELLNAQIM